MLLPDLKDLKSPKDDIKIIRIIEDKVLKSAYELLDIVNKINIERSIKLQIATSESLTAGLIMSSLVKLPILGWAKYGCFGVYDSDAKRVFNSVKVEDLYTHMCAKQMAIGMLKNSNATLAISVTGNAMPYYNDLNRLGEVFIGIAAYNNNSEIIYTTEAVNSCLDTIEIPFKEKCEKWIGEHLNESTFADRKNTATISLLIRNYTAYIAMKMASDFIKKHENTIGIPDFIEKRKDDNDVKIGCNHTKIPLAKYDAKINEICLNETQRKCQVSLSCKREDEVKEIPEGWTAKTVIQGGKRTRKQKTLKFLNRSQKKNKKIRK